MAKPTVSREGAIPGTEYLAVAQSIHGKLVILGDLEPSNDKTKVELASAITDLATPGSPMHLLRVVVIGRCLRLEGEQVEPSIIMSDDKI